MSFYYKVFVSTNFIHLNFSRIIKRVLHSEIDTLLYQQIYVYYIDTYKKNNSKEKKVN